MQRLLKPVLVGALLLAGTMAYMPVAQAAETTASDTDQRCKPYEDFDERTTVCINDHGSHVSGMISWDDFIGPDVASLTVYVQQCRVAPPNRPYDCATIAANSAIDNEVSTSMKPSAHGHVYRACGSAGDFVNVCSPFVSE